MRQLTIMLLVYTVALFVLFYTLNRGKVRMLHLLVDIFYSLLIGIPLIVASLYRWQTQQPRFLPVLWIIPLILMAPFLVVKWRNVIKGRDSLLQAATFSCALICFYSIVFCTPFQAIGAVAIGMIFIVIFFYHNYRYPYFNSGWLSNMIDESAKEAVHKGRYSAKPVLINIPTGTRFFTGTSGLSLLSKKNLVICRISKTLHQKIGSPNLEEFFTLLCQKIQAESKSKK